MDADAEYYYDQGLTAAVRGRTEEAIESLQQAIKLDGSMVPAYHQLGKVYLKSGNFGEAVTYLQAALDRRPQQTAIYVDLGQAYIGARDFDRAQDAFLSGLAIAQNDIRALNGLSTIFFFLEHINEHAPHGPPVPGKGNSYFKRALVHLVFL